MRVGVLFNDDVWNGVYRAAGIADALLARRIAVEGVIYRGVGRLDARPLLSCDVVHIYRRGEPAVLGCVDQLRRRGTAIVWDNDDDVRLLPAEGTRISKKQAERDFQAQVKMLRRADVVTTTSEVLARTYREAGAAEVRVIENYLMAAQRARPAARTRDVVLGWVAAQEHVADARLLDIEGALRRVMDRHPELRVVTVGLRLEGLNPARYTHHPKIPLFPLKDEMAKWDVAIAPLADIPMSYARSNVKVKEYSAAGAAWLASARGPYANLGPKQGGLLVEDDAWEAAIDHLVATPKVREQLRRDAAAWSATQMLDRHVDKWLRAFEDARALARRRAGTPVGS